MIIQGSAVHNFRNLLGLGVLIAACAALPARADNLVIATPSQTDFDSFAKDVTAAFDYRPFQPAASGITGLDVSTFGGAARIHDRSAFHAVTGHDDSNIYVGGVQVAKGLPGGWEVGGFVAGVSDNGITLYGAQLRYAVLAGTPVTPSLVVSGHYTGASGIDDFNYRSWGTDVTVAQSLLFVTPYAGIGYVWGRLSPRHGIALEPATADRVKGFAGVRFALLPIMHVGAQYERLGATNVYSLRVGVSI